MRTNIKKYILIASVAIGASLTSCINDLDTEPIDPNYKSGNNIYVSAESYKQGLAKIYGSYTLAGQNGAGGNADIAGPDAGATVYSRLLFYVQEHTTDENVVAWDDGDVKELNTMNWTSGNGFISFMYSRLYLTIGFANQYLRDTEEGKLLSSLTAEDKADIVRYRAEARLLRAFTYYHAMDMFGNVPIITDADPVGNWKPTQNTRAEIFEYVEEEVLAIESDLAEPRANEYGRTDKGFAWSLMARMYLNAKEYIGQEKFAECITYCEKIIPNYSINGSYQELFLADNHLRTNEMIFAFACDGLNSQTYGATTYIIHSAIGGKYLPETAGIDGGWGGNRPTSIFVDKFEANDSRGMFFTEEQTKEVTDMNEFTNGYIYDKYKNVTSAGDTGSDLGFVDTDFPIFRLADVYLMYAESVLRGGGGSASTALGYINELRTRAYGDDTGNITAGGLDLDFILDERARELGWECVRRTDLIRFGKFVGDNYLWEWKGGTKNGKAVGDHYKLFPIPLIQINGNTSLDQNIGY